MQSGEAAGPARPGVGWGERIGHVVWRPPGGLHGISRQRARFHLAYRLGIRVYGVSQALKRSKPSVVAGGAALSLGADVALWALLRRSEKLHFWSRLAVETVDTAAWSRGVDAPPEAATLPSVPFGMEVGSRIGLAGLVVPLVQGAVTTLVRRQAGRRTPPATFGWVVMSVVFGNLVHLYEERQGDAAVDLFGQSLAARRQAAVLAGQNEVAMGADTVIDELARVEYLLAAVGGERADGPDGGVPGGGTEPTAAPEPVGTGRALAEWKASLATSTSGQAVYLATALARWQRRRYSTVLADDADLRIAAGQGTTILSAGQAASLVDWLDRLDLRGPVVVEASPRRLPAIPGDPLRLLVGPHVVELPADPQPVIRPFDPAPLVVLSSAMFAASLSTDGHGAVPWTATVPAAIAAAPAALWAHRLTTRSDRPGEPVILAAIGLAWVQAMIAAPLQRAPFDHEGVQNFPVLTTLAPAAVLIGRYLETMTPVALARAAAAAGLAVAANLVLLPRPVRWLEFAVAVGELVAVVVSSTFLQHELDYDRDRLVSELAGVEARELEASFDQGRQSVRILVADTLVTTERRLDQLRDEGHIDPRFDGEIRRRLDEARRMLAAV